MKHSERGCLRSARRVERGHTIDWCDRECLVTAVSMSRTRTGKLWVRFTVQVSDIGERQLSYEADEKVHVVDYDDPRLVSERR